MDTTKNRKRTSKSEPASKTVAYDTVFQTILDALDKGVVPWSQPWEGSFQFPRSMSTGRGYRGINVFILALKAMEKGYASPWWGTYDQIASKGGQVRKGEKSTTVVFWKRIKVATTADEKAATGKDTKIIPLLRYFRVFNASQADGLPEKYQGTLVRAEGFDPIAEAEAILEGYENSPEIRYEGARAFYQPLTDIITVPERTRFSSADGFYSTIFHEVAHSTGHKDRLARPNMGEPHRFGDEAYSKEELVAEMGSSFLCAQAGLLPEVAEQNAAYLASWLRNLPEGPKVLVQAAAAAQKAADHVLGVKWAEDADDSSKAEAVAA